MVNEKEYKNKNEENLLGCLGIAYWQWTPKDGYYHSKEYEKYAISQMEPEKIWDEEAPFAYVHPDDIPLMKKFMQVHPEDEIKKSAVVRCKMCDGSYQWTELFSFAENDKNGNLERLVSAMRDVDKEWIASRSVEQKNIELNHIIDSTSGGIATYCIKDTIQLRSLSDSLIKRLNYTQEEVAMIQEKDALDYVHPSDCQLIKEKVKQVIKTKKPQTLAYRLIKKDQTYKWFRASMYHAGDSDGFPMIYEVLTDIAEVNADYVDTLNQTNEVIVIADWESRDILYCNQAAAKMADMNILDLFGQKCSQVQKKCNQVCEHCFQKQLNYDELIIQPEAIDKQYFLKKGKRILWNGREAFIEYLNDITAQHNMTEKTVFERDLLSSATKVLFPLCMIVNLTQDTYTVIEHDDFQTTTKDTSGRFRQLLESAIETIPKDYQDTFISHFSIDNLLKSYSDGKQSLSLTHPQIGDDGVIHWNHTTVVFAEQLLNEDLYFIVFSYNVDEQKKNEETVKNALKDAKHANMAKTAFLSRISHDMRTPLNGILGLTTILKDSILDEDMRQDIVEMELSGKYLLNLINDTLDMSRIENGKLELHPVVCDGRDLFNNALTLVKTNAVEKNIKLNIFAENLPFTMLYVDSGRIEQIVLNIANNAVKFTPDNGHIDITMKNISVEDDIITDVLEIRDYGVGMSKEFLPHIFEAFSQEDMTRTSSHQGTGLGMAITYELIHLMGGDISVQSELNIGTCFTVTLRLPIASQEQIDAWKRNRIIVDRSAGLQQKRILLCEDHPVNTKISKKLLEIKGAFVDHAPNGKIAVEMFENSSIGYYDAILMDIRMPVMDGLDATKTIRQLTRKDAHRIPIIAMTANAFAQDVQQTKMAGMNAHLSKPVDPQVLYNTLSKFLKTDNDIHKPIVLIVDDIELNRVVIRTSLEDDYELLEAENGIEALKIVERTKGLDAIITDIQMPEMDGVELIKAIRSDRQYNHIVIIANTQFGDMDQEETLLALGANDFVYKPTTPKIVKIRIQNALKRV